MTRDMLYSCFNKAAKQHSAECMQKMGFVPTGKYDTLMGAMFMCSKVGWFSFESCMISPHISQSARRDLLFSLLSLSSPECLTGKLLRAQRAGHQRYVWLPALGYTPIDELVSLYEKAREYTKTSSLTL